MASAAAQLSCMTAPVRIATRASELALRQARVVQSALEAGGTTAELVTFKTVGDKKLDESLSAIGAKGLFTKELEDALASGKVDCCVHSLKDLPTDMPAGLALVAMLEREDPRDVLVVNDRIFAESLEELPRGSRVGTSSLRRRAQLLHRRADLEVVELRGNVPTRLRKVDEGQVHAAILAAAGLKRLGVHQRIDAWLDAPAWLPAAGQGVIAVEARAHDARMAALLAPLHHAASAFAALAERSLLAALDGGCQVPIGALLMGEGPDAVLFALVSDLSGKRVVRGSLVVGTQSAEEVGEALAASMRVDGATEILATLREATKVPSPQPE
jgi:hydroxymethylbilane synthase